MKFEAKNYQLTFSRTENGIAIAGGFFGEIQIAESELFKLRVKHVKTGEEVTLTSLDGWGSIQVSENENETQFIFSHAATHENLAVTINASADEEGISFGGGIQNDNEEWSAMELSYPTPLVCGDELDLFVPAENGLVIKNATDEESFKKYIHGTVLPYPSRRYSMQFFAAYGKKSGIYLGFHDGTAAAKETTVSSNGGKIGFSTKFYGIGASLPQNSFELRGVCRWQYLGGDWYDAALIYREFVKKEAFWLPEAGADGRTDIDERFRDIPFWVQGGMPQTPLDKDLKIDFEWENTYEFPATWYELPIRLQKELGVPIAMHIYNWHNSPFDVGYPHYKAKKEYVKHADKLRENNILVVPYINGISWEMTDAIDGYEVNYDNTGKPGVAIKEDGSERYTLYKKTNKNGVGSKLAPMCPTYKKWWEIMGDVTSYLVDDVGFDGVYYDQITAHAGFPCYSHDHGHLPGGGSYWAEEYVAMLEQIRRDVKKHGYLFSECNSESYMKGLDGLLTWTWAYEGEVPAFVTVYAGYTQFVGRSFGGNAEWFRCAVARCLLYGQQIGWCSPSIVNDQKKVDFLKKYVKIRYDYAKFFRAATLCRPPKVSTSAPTLQSPPHLWFTAPVIFEQVQAAAWQSYEGDKIVLFIANLNEEESDFNLCFSASEYGINPATLPADFNVDGDTVTKSGVIAAGDCLVFEFQK